MGNHLTTFILDKGASLNYICATQYNRSPKPRLHKAAVRVYTWMSKEPLPCLGKFQTTLTYKERTEAADCLLSLPMAECLKLIKILYKVDDKPDIIHKFPKLFTGL